MDSSPLALLPPELRNKIYTHTFTTPYAVQLSPRNIFHPLTRTCRQIRHESLQMFLSLTRFNAHLDDGPATPLARWLTVLGPRLCLRVREVKVWDLHMLNGTLHGEAATGEMLREGPGKDEEGTGGSTEGGVGSSAARSGSGTGRYVLRPVGRQVFHRGWYLKDVILALQAMGLGLARFCIVQEGSAGERMKQTSDFALMPMAELEVIGGGGRGGGSGAGAGEMAANAETLAEQFGLSEAERQSLAEQLERGYSEVRLLEGRRNIIMKFDETRRLVSLRQEFIPRDEEFYL